MGIKEILEKLKPKPIQSNSLRLSSDELELQSYEKEDRKDAIRNEVFKRRKEKSNRFMSGKAFNVDPIPKMSSRKAFEGEIVKAETEKIKREAFFEEQKKLAKLLGKKEAVKSLKNRKLKKSELKVLKKLISQSKKKSTSSGRIDKLLIPNIKGKLISNKPLPTGSFFGSLRPIGNVLKSSNNTQQSGNILKAKNAFFR